MIAAAGLLAKRRTASMVAGVSSASSSSSFTSSYFFATIHPIYPSSSALPVSSAAASTHSPARLALARLSPSPPLFVLRFRHRPRSWSSRSTSTSSLMAQTSAREKEDNGCCSRRPFASFAQLASSRSTVTAMVDDDASSRATSAINGEAENERRKDDDGIEASTSTTSSSPSPARSPEERRALKRRGYDGPPAGHLLKGGRARTTRPSPREEKRQDEERRGRRRHRRPPHRSSSPQNGEHGSRHRPTRNRRGQQHQQNDRRHRHNNRRRQGAPRPVPTSPWIVVSNIPPMSRLDDVLDGVERVLAAELALRDGIIVDLDALEWMLMESSREKRDEVKGADASEATGGGDGDDSGSSTHGSTEDGSVEGDEVQADGEDGQPVASTSAYDHHKDDDGPPPLPAWDYSSYLSSTASSSEQTLSIRSMVLEARLRLSGRGVPTGWYLRFPNRSVVHALLTHVDEAFDAMRKADAAKRRREREERIAKRREEMDGGVDGIDARGEAENDRQGSAASEKAKICDGTVDAGDDEYEEQPYEHDLELLRCGGSVLDVEEFRPDDYDGRLPRRRRSKAYDDFRRGAELQLSDNVVRVENCPSAATIDDVKSLFYHYELAPEPIMAHDALSTPSAGGPQERSGAGRGRRRPSSGEEEWSERCRPAVEPLVDAEIRGGAQTFLVRFEDASWARAAVRDRQSAMLREKRVQLARYPRQIL